jgi:methylenetetrahydrofolate reductase (NADPH)
VLVLRGDPEKSAGIFQPKAGGHTYASELVTQVDNMNKGILLNAETEMSLPIFASEWRAILKSISTLRLRFRLCGIEKKIELGANYIVTQMFFDNQKYFQFVERCRAEGITVPIIPGLKPLSTRKQLSVLADIFHLEFPRELVDEVNKCASDKDVRQVGIEWGIQQCKELMAYGVPVLHFIRWANPIMFRRSPDKFFRNRILRYYS